MTTNSSKKPAKTVFKLLYFVGLGLLIYLGSWQLSRGLEKANLDKVIGVRANQLELQVKPENWEKLKYQIARLKGNWISGKFFLLDNRIHKGVAGYEVLVPFQFKDSETTLLVNRGWIARTDTGKTKIAPAIEWLTVSGQIYQPSKGFTLGSAYTDSCRWPVVIQYIDPPVLSEALAIRLEPVVLVQTEAETPFIRKWKPYVINPQRHYGYAAQWWGLALVMLVFGIIWSRKKQS